MFEYKDQIFIENVNDAPKTVEDFNKFANEIGKVIYNQTLYTMIVSMQSIIIKRVDNAIYVRSLIADFYEDHPELVQFSKEVTRFVDSIAKSNPKMSFEKIVKGNGSFEGLAKEFKKYQEEN